MSKTQAKIELKNIELKNIHKAYGEKTVLNDFNLAITGSEITVIMGASGAGKTTLLRLIAGLETPDRGTVTGAPEAKSMLFQEDRLCEQLSAAENVSLALKPKNKKERKAVLSNIEKHFQRTGLDLSHHETSPVRELSGGMKRRVALVRAMIADSELILLDEPCKGLDEATKELTLKYIKEERRGRTMIVVTHDADEASFFDGKIISL